MKFNTFLGLTIFVLFMGFINTLESQVTYKFYINNLNSVILNAHGNVTTLTAQQFVILYANPLNVIPAALNLKTLSAMLNAKNQNAKSNALIKDVKCLIALNV